MLRLKGALQKKNEKKKLDNWYNIKTMNYTF